jgi:hypothetical protein
MFAPFKTTLTKTKHLHINTSIKNIKSLDKTSLISS